MPRQGSHCTAAIFGIASAHQSRTMAETIALEIKLQAFVRRETAQRCVAACPQIGVVSQGRTVREAKGCLQEAVELWFESCIERGVLDRALREANFQPSSAGNLKRADFRNSRRRRSPDAP